MSSTSTQIIMEFYKYPEAYVVEELISNYKQLAVGDVVTVTISGWNSLQNKHRFWRDAAIFSVLGAFTFGAATGFGALGSGFGGGLAVSSEAIAAAGAGAGAALGGGIGMADNALAATKIPANKVLKSMGMIGQVINIDEKNFSKEHHIQVRFYIPQEDASYIEKDVWIDAHHLMKMITKDLSEKRAKLEKEKADKLLAEYNDKLLTEHRERFAPENAELIIEISELQGQLQEAKRLAQARGTSAKIFAAMTVTFGSAFIGYVGFNAIQGNQQPNDLPAFREVFHYAPSQVDSHSDIDQATKQHSWLAASEKQPTAS